MDSTKIAPTSPHDYGTKHAFLSIDDIRDKKVTVMGLGLHGGGEASVRFFLHHGAYVTITDMKTPEELAPSIASLTNDPTLDTSRLRYVLGTHTINDFKNADCVIKNPGVKYEKNIYLAAAKYIETDISIFLQFTQSPIIAITGSKGKSSTVSAIHYGLNKAGIETLLGGNITLSPLTFFDKTIPHDQNTTNEKLPIVILELSSWQLADLRGRKLLKPKIALITKIVPDHQNWYGTMEPYIADKKLIYADQTKDDITLCAATESTTSHNHTNQHWGDIFAHESKAQVLRYPNDIPSNLQNGFDTQKNWLNHLKILGEHSKENILNAAFIMHLMGIHDKQTINILKDYPGIAHRLEFFHTWKTTHTLYRFYNDSAATVPESVVAALSSFTEGLHLISGGTDKNLDFFPLAQALTDKKEGQLISFFLLAGTGTDKLIRLLTAHNKKTNSPPHTLSWHGPYDNLTTLLTDLKQYIATNKTTKEQSIVFSPGATSFGMFKNEFDRGTTFKKLVLQIFD